MDIEIAKYSGYCYGVERAFKMVMATSAKKNDSLYTLGPIIHNRQAVEELMNQHGVGYIDSLDEIDSGTVVIRTHGVPPEIIKRAMEKGLKVVDATCPFVKKAQSDARKLVKEGYQLVIIGEKNHPEIIGIKAHAGGIGRVVETEEEAQALPHDWERIGIVIQTTQESEKVSRIIGLLSMKARDVRIFNTICDATFHRQSSARDLAGRVDVMLVVGGKHSGNTRRLFDICRKTGARTYHIETAKEIKSSWFDHVERLGITGGASTPAFILQQVIQKVHDIDRKKGE